MARAMPIAAATPMAGAPRITIVLMALATSLAVLQVTYTSDAGSLRWSIITTASPFHSIVGSIVAIVSGPRLQAPGARPAVSDFSLSPFAFRLDEASGAGGYQTAMAVSLSAASAPFHGACLRARPPDPPRTPTRSAGTGRTAASDRSCRPRRPRGGTAGGLPTAP